MYYSSSSSNSSIQGETTSEEQNWPSHPAASTTLPATPMTLPVAEARQLETTADSAVPIVNQDVETSSPLSSPNILSMDDHTPKNIPEVSLTSPINVSNSSNYQLPYRYNRGKPRN